MRTFFSMTRMKRVALAAFLGCSPFPVCANAGELIDTHIADADAVSQTTAQIPVPQDALPELSSPALPQNPVPPGPESLPGGQAVPPGISEPFATPENLASPFDAAPPAGLAPPTPTPNFGRAPGNFAAVAALGSAAGSFSSAPTMMGDLFGGGVSIIKIPSTITTSAFLPGTILSGSDSTAILSFDFGGGTPNDLFTAAGTGQDLSGDSLTDRFDLLEPTQGSDAPTSPGPGFVFNGGTATYTNGNANPNAVLGMFQSGQTWFINYSYVSSIGNDGEPIVIAGPDVATRRVKLSENFSPEVRDRLFFNYNFFNDAFGGIGDVSRYVLDMERIVIDELMSIEVRLPMAGTLSSRQQLGNPGERSFELGNATAILKAVLLRTDRFTLSGGSGVTIPLADDARLLQGNNELLRIENEAVHILPFLGLLTKFDRRTFFQSYIQLDVDANGNPVLANLAGGPLQGLGRFTDSTLAHVDASAHRIVYENKRRSSLLKGVIANAEIHYTGTLQSTDVVAGQGIAVTDLKNNFNILNTTVGAHFLVGKNVVVTPGMSIPLRSGLDRQFDYEAILQLNYIR